MKFYIKNDYFYLASLSIVGWAINLLRYSFGRSDQTEQLPIIYRLMDKQYLINDWYVNANSGISPRFYYASIMAHLGEIVKLEYVFFALFLISTLIIFLSIALISYKLFNSLEVSTITIASISFISLILGGISLGGNWVIPSMLLPGAIAITIALVGLYLIFDGKYLISSLLIGIATIFQPLYGLQFFGIFVAIMLSRYFTQKNPKELITSVLPFFLFGVIGLLPSIIASGGQSLEIFNIITYIRHPHHYCPFSFSISSYILFFVILLIFIIALIKYPPNKKYNNIVLIICSVIGVYAILGTIFVEIFPITTIGKLQLFKLTWLITLFGVMYGCNAFYRQFNFKKIKISHIEKYYKHILIIAIIFAIFPIINANTAIQSSVYQPEYDWIMSNTSPDSVFLIPPNMEDFRVKANRAIFVDYKAFPFPDEAVLEWYHRYQMVKDYENLTEARVNQISEVQTIDYIITYCNPLGDKEPMFVSEHLCIYQNTCRA